MRIREHQNMTKHESLEEELSELKDLLITQQEFTRLSTAINRAETKTTLNTSKINLLEGELGVVKSDISSIRRSMEKASEERHEIRESILKIREFVGETSEAVHIFIKKYNDTLWKNILYIMIAVVLPTALVFWGFYEAQKSSARAINETQLQSIRLIKNDIIKCLIKDKISEKPERKENPKD